MAPTHGPDEAATVVRPHLQQRRRLRALRQHGDPGRHVIVRRVEGEAGGEIHLAGEHRDGRARAPWSTSTSGRVTSHSDTAASPSVAVRADRISRPSRASPPAIAGHDAGPVARHERQQRSTAVVLDLELEVVGAERADVGHRDGRRPALVRLRSGVGGPPARTSCTLATRPSTSPRRHDDHADGPVARASAWVSAASRSRNVAVSTISATFAAVDGSSMSRRVAMFGSSRCQRTSRPIGPRVGVVEPPARRRCRRPWRRPPRCGRRDAPCRCRAGAHPRRAGRGGRRPRTSSAALTHVSMLCRSTV